MTVKYVNNNLKDLRESKNWSQKDIADKLELTDKAYSKIERGECGINMERLKQLADIFSIDMVKLTEQDDKGIIFFISGNNSGGNRNNGETNYYNDSQSVVNELEKLKLSLEHTKELLEKEKEQNAQLKKDLAQKDNHIDTLNALLKKLT